MTPGERESEKWGGGGIGGRPIIFGELSGHHQNTLTFGDNGLCCADVTLNMYCKVVGVCQNQHTIYLL